MILNTLTSLSSGVQVCGTQVYVTDSMASSEDAHLVFIADKVQIKPSQEENQ